MDIFNTVAGTASIIGLFLAIVGGGGYFYYKKIKSNTVSQKIKGNSNVQAGRDINIKK